MKVKVIITSVFILFLYFSLKSKIEIISPSLGVISIIDSDVTILSPDSGMLTKINVTSGQSVNVGDELIVLKNIDDWNELNATNDLLTTYEEKLIKIERESKYLEFLLDKANSINEKEQYQPEILSTSPRLEKIRNFLTFYSLEIGFHEKAKKSFKTAERNFNDQIFHLEKKSKLIFNSVGESVRYLDSKIEIARIRQLLLENSNVLDASESRMIDAKYSFYREGLNVSDIILREKFESNEKYASNLASKKLIEERINTTKIVSSIDGHVFSLKEGMSESTYIERNTEIMSLKRVDDGVYIEAKLESTYRPYINIGREAKITIDSPGIKNIFNGTVAEVSVDSFEYEESSKADKRYYKLKVKFDSDFEANENMIGIKTVVNIINGEIFLYEYLLSIFNKSLSFEVW